MKEGRAHAALTLVLGQGNMPPEEDAMEGSPAATAEAEPSLAGKALCANGCGRLRSQGYPSCCRTCMRSHGQHHGPICEDYWKQTDGPRAQPKDPPAPAVNPPYWSLLRNWCPAAQDPLWLRTHTIAGEHYNIGDPIPDTWSAL